MLNHFPDTLIHNHLELTMGLVHIVSSELQCPVNSHNIQSYEHKIKNDNILLQH